jgi:hypothetical protein
MISMAPMSQPDSVVFIYSPKSPRFARTRPILPGWA